MCAVVMPKFGATEVRRVRAMPRPREGIDEGVGGIVKWLEARLESYATAHQSCEDIIDREKGTAVALLKFPK